MKLLTEQVLHLNDKDLLKGVVTDLAQLWTYHFNFESYQAIKKTDVAIYTGKLGSKVIKTRE